MNITTQLFAVAAMLVCGICGTQAQGYQLTGTIEGMPNGTRIKLVPMSHDNEKAIDSAVVNNGNFVMKGSVEFPTAAYLQVNKAYGAVDIMLENTNMQFKATATRTKNKEGIDSYVFSDVRITGSALNDKYYGFLQQRHALDSLYRATHQPYEAAWEQVNKARAARDTAQVKQLMAQPLMQKALDDDKRFFQTVETTITKLINDNRETYWGPLLALRLMSYFTPEQADMYNSFSDEAKNSIYGKKVRKEVFPDDEVGRTAVNFSVKTDNGKTTDLKTLAKGAAYVLVDFWASWCKPCRMEMPNVKALYAKYKEKGFKPVSISIDRNINAWKKAQTEEKLPWPSFHDDLGAADAYAVRAIPAMFLIDAKTLKIVAVGDNARGSALAQKLAQLLP